MLGNEESRAWHYRFGFVDEPSVTITRLYYYHAEHTLEQREQAGDLSQAERVALVAERDRLASQLDALQQAESRYFRLITELRP